MIQTVPALTEESIHIWTIPLAETKKHISEWLEVLSPDERYRAGRLRTPKDRVRFVTSRGTLRSILGAYLEIETSAVEFSYGPWGKPCLASTETRLLHFNFSHSENFALCGLTRSRRTHRRADPALPQPSVRSDVYLGAVGKCPFRGGRCRVEEKRGLRAAPQP